jgi:MFS family permease
LRYCRDEGQLRQALFFSAASVAGAFSGLLAFGIAKMDGVGGLEGWRWIFILEGIATVLVAILAYFCLFDFPETASFLTEEERAFVVYRLKYQGQVHLLGHARTAQVAQAEEFRWAYVRQAFSDWQIWVNIIVYWAVSNSRNTRKVQYRKLIISSRLFAHCTVSLYFFRLS